MKKFLMAVAVLMFAIFMMVGVTYAHDISATCEKSSQLIMIVMDDGSVYEMSKGEVAQWEFFICNTSRAKNLEAVLVKVSPTKEHNAQFKVNIQAKQRFSSKPQSFDDYVWSGKKVNIDKIIEVVEGFIL